MPNLDHWLTKKHSGKRIDKSGFDGSESTTNYSGQYLDHHVRTGVRLQNWRRIIASGGDATTAFSGTKEVYRVLNGEYSIWHKDTSNPLHKDFYGSTFTGFINDNLWGYYPTVGGLDTQHAENQALTYFLRNVRNSRRSLQGGVLLGELRETLGMLRRPASALREGFSSYLNAVRSRTSGLRSKDFSRKGRDASLRKMISGTWLEYRFGWSPLISDIDGIAKAAAAISTRHFQTRATGVGVVEKSADSTIRFGAIKGIFRREEKYEVIYRSGLNETTPGVSSNLETLGLGLRDFIPTVWELIPYSFVVDYFTNIGDLLDAATTSTSNLAWCNKTTRRTTVWEQQMCADAGFTAQSYPPPFVSFVIATSPEILKYRLVTVSRSRVVNPGVPSFEFSLPSLGQSLNLAALLDQADSTSRGITRRFR